MDNKKSFLIFKDALSIADDLNDEQLGRLFRAIINFQLQRPNEMDFVTKLAFSPFKAQFDRDDKKWQMKASVNRINGNKGGRPRKEKQTQENPKNPDGFFETHGNPQKPVTVTVSVTDNVNEILSNVDQIESQKTKLKKIVTRPEGVPVEVWEEFKAIKKTKKQRLSDLSMRTLENNAQQCGISLAQCLSICVERGWGTFKPEYMVNKFGSGHTKINDLSNVNYNVKCDF